MSRQPPTRWVPALPLPPYTYVPGLTPHPLRDPGGHRQSLGDPPPRFALDHWSQCCAYLYGIDLFDHGYYWEAHEAWEPLWLAAGRRGPLADFLKALIKLAAAGVKRREGSAAGTQRHLLRAAQLLRGVAATLSDQPPGDRWLMGMPLDQLAAEAAALAATPDAPLDTTVDPPLAFSLRLPLRLPR